MSMRRALRTLLVLALVSVGTVAPLVAQQVASPQDTSISEAQLAAYAKAYVAIGAARDSAHAHLALARNKTDANQRELRDTLKQRIEQIVLGQGLTLELYNRITFVISRDEARRKRFEELVAAVPKGDSR